MKGKVKRKVVTSGRLSGAVRASRGSINPGMVRPEPAYSLYSTDSENQVSTLHQGLDRCAALLSNLLQAEHAGKSPVLTAKDEDKPAAPPTSQVKKVLKKVPTHTGQRGAANNTRARSHSVPAAGVRFHPAPRGPPAAPRGPPAAPRGPPAAPRGPPAAPRGPPAAQRGPPAAQRGPPAAPRGPSATHRGPPPPQTTLQVPHKGPPPPPSAPLPLSSVLLSVHQSSSNHRCVPEAPPTPQLHQEEEDDLVPVRDSDSVMLKDCVMTKDAITLRDDMTMDRTKTLQNLLSELKALITGHGSVAEMLLSRLELIVSSSLQSNGTTDLLALQSENTQLRRRVRTLNQQLQQMEEAENQCSSQGPALQEDNLAEVRRALEDTRSRLEDREQENARLQTDLEEARRRLQEGEQQRSRLEEELRSLNRLLQVSCSSGGPAIIDTNHSVQDPSAPPANRIAHYLESLSQSDPGTAAEPFPPPEPWSQRLSTHPYPSRGPSEPEPPGPPHSGSAWSESSFNTRDEAAFRDGLAALDASIASLQRSIQLDLRR